MFGCNSFEILSKAATDPIPKKKHAKKFIYLSKSPGDGIANHLPALNQLGPKASVLD